MPFRRVALLAALKREIRPILRSLPFFQHERQGTATVYRYRGPAECVLVETGAGSGHAAAGARWVLDRYAPDAVVSLGFAGGLTPGLRPGSIVWGVRVVEYHADAPGPHGSARLVSLDLEPPSFAGPGTRGTIVTTDKPPKKAVVSALLPREWHPAVVDMESVYVARECAERGVPVLGVRAVCDELAFEPNLELDRILDASGRVAVRKALRYAMGDLDVALRFLLLGARSAKAARSLAAAVHDLVAG